jgi:hypothetical protein
MAAKNRSYIFRQKQNHIINRIATYNDDNHSRCRFSAYKPSTTQQDDNGDRDGCHGERKLGSTFSRDQHQELDGETQEEEEIKLQEGDVNLVSEVTALHLQIRADMLVDSPRELVIEFPSDKSHQQCPQGHNARNDDEERLRLVPHIQLDLVHIIKGCDSFSNLLHLHSAIDQETDIANTQPNDLNGILHPQSVIHQDQFIEETKTIEGEEGGDCFGGGTIVGQFLDLEIRENISASASVMPPHSES